MQKLLHFALLFYILVKYFVYFFSLNIGSQLELELEPEPPLFHGAGQKGRLRLHNTGSRRKGGSSSGMSCSSLRIWGWGVAQWGYGSVFQWGHCDTMLHAPWHMFESRLSSRQGNAQYMNLPFLRSGTPKAPGDKEKKRWFLNKIRLTDEHNFESLKARGGKVLHLF